MLYKHVLQFSLSLGDQIPRATTGYDDSCSSLCPGSPHLSSFSITKFHWGTTLETDHAHITPSHWADTPCQGLRVLRVHHHVLSMGFIPREFS